MTGLARPPRRHLATWQRHTQAGVATPRRGSGRPDKQGWAIVADVDEGGGLCGGRGAVRRRSRARCRQVATWSQPTRVSLHPPFPSLLPPTAVYCNRSPVDRVQDVATPRPCSKPAPLPDVSVDARILPMTGPPNPPRARPRSSARPLAIPIHLSGLSGEAPAARSPRGTPPHAVHADSARRPHMPQGLQGSARLGSTALTGCRAGHPSPCTARLRASTAPGSRGTTVPMSRPGSARCPPGQHLKDTQTLNTQPLSTASTSGGSARHASQRNMRRRVMNMRQTKRCLVG